MFENILKNALQAGIEYNQFLDMSMWEITEVVEAKLELRKIEHKNKIAADYNLAVNIANFVNLMLAGEGKKIPELHKLYPDLFSNIEASEWTGADTAKWVAFAQSFNSSLEHKKDR